jgi:hypothetical protein
MTTLLTRLPRRPDAGLLITLALCAFSLWPLLYRPGLPNGTDVLYHVYRAAEMDRSWAHGVLFPRWAEAFYTGYGSPVFNYYASLAYYLTSLFARLFSFDPVNSLRLLIALCKLGGGLGMYLFVSNRFNKLGGVLAALVYVYSPYLLYTEPYARGDYPEGLAFALLPLLFWRFDCLLRYQRGRDVTLAALTAGALIISHNLMAIVLTGLLAGWLVWQKLLGGANWRNFILAGISLALGVSLSAWFWLPILFERGEVHLDNLIAVAQLDYRNFFIPLNKLLEFTPRADAGAVNGLLLNLRLGVATWTLALAGVAGVVIVRSRTSTREKPAEDVGARRASPLQPPFSDMLFFALAALAMLFLMTPQSEGIWAHVGPLAFLQFPWRFLGPSVFCLAVLAGANGLWLERLPARLGAALAGAAVVLIICLALPTFYAPEWVHTTVDTSVAAYQQAEVRGLQRATTFSNEFLPKAVKVEPDPTQELLAAYAAGYPVDKLHREALPSGATAELLEHGPQHDAWRVSSPTAFQMEALTFDFAGWTAQVDGAPVSITPSDPHGLITFPVPAGEHTVRLYLGSTPPRALGTVVSLLALAGVVALAVLQAKATVGARHALPLQTPALADTLLKPSAALGLLGGGGAALLLAVALLRPGGAWLDSPPGQAYPAAQQAVYHFGDDIQLLGYDLNSQTFRPGDHLELSVYWYATRTPAYGYASFVHVSTGGPPLAQADKQNPAGRPTKEWTPAGYIRDDYDIELPATLPPGEYQLLVGLYTCDTRPTGGCGNGDRLPVTDASGKAVGDALPLTTIQVR